MTEPQQANDGLRHARLDHLTEAVSRAQEGDENAFRHVYHVVQPRLLNYARALVGEMDAEDTTAEAWACIARDLHRFHGDGRSFLSWTVSITRHRAADHLRRRRPVTSVANERLPEQVAPHDTADQAVEALTTAQALNLIGRLPTDQAQAILLRVVMGLDTTSAARVLGKRSGAVRTAAHRGLRTLARHLHTDDLEEPDRPESANRLQAAVHPIRRPTSRPAPMEY